MENSVTLNASLIENKGIGGLGDNTFALQESSGRILAYFAIRRKEPVLYIPNVLSNQEFETVNSHWRQYYERNTQHTSSKFGMYQH